MTNFKVANVANDDPPLPDWVVQRVTAADIELVECLCGSGDEVVRLAADADLIWVMGGGTVISAETLQHLPKCRVILRTGSGTDNIPVSAATRHGIVVANTPEATMRPVAEHTIGLLFSVVRCISLQHRLTAQGHWDLTGELGKLQWPNIEDLVLGLIGFGYISRQIVKKLRGFEMKILAADPGIDTATMRAHGVEPVGMDRLLEKADVVSVHTPLLDQTHHLISQREFRMMKPEAIFINTSRGPVVDEGALIRALREGWIAAAALDVLEQEPPVADNPLRTMDNVVLTPHIASHHRGSIDVFLDHSVRTVIEVSKGRMPPWVVNPQVKPRWEIE